MRKNLEYTPSTAHKRSVNFQTSFKQENSPNLMTPSNRRKCSQFSQKVSSLRETIDELISSVAGKQSLQRSAVQKVWDVNTELGDSLSSNDHVYERVLSVHSLRSDQANKVSYKTSAFGERSTHVENRSEYLSPQSLEQQQTLRLKQSINNQMRSTNELMLRLKSLQNQHEYLRSTYKPNIQSESDIEENKRLKEELARIQRSQSDGYTIDQLWREFCQLKAENQALRKETVAMLKGDCQQYHQNYSSACVY